MTNIKNKEMMEDCPPELDELNQSDCDSSAKKNPEIRENSNKSRGFKSRLKSRVCSKLQSKVDFTVEENFDVMGGSDRMETNVMGGSDRMDFDVLRSRRDQS